MSGSDGSELYLAVTSRGSEDVFPNNCGNSFTNILAEKINLDPNIRHEVGLVSHHMPAYGAVLHKDDHVTSNIQYNIGLFNYDNDKKEYVIDTNFNRKLFSLAPNKNINGLYDHDEEGSIDRAGPLNRMGNYNYIQG